MSHARLARLLGTSAVALITVMSGCQGHGQYTTEQINVAKKKMDVMKSGTEWETAHSSYMAGDLEKALKAVDRSLALNDQVPKSYVLRGRILFELSRLDEAMEAFNKALELDKDFTDAEYYLGLSYERLADRESAFTHFNRASQLDPENPHYLIAAAETQIDAGKPEIAEALLAASQPDVQNHPGVKQTRAHIATMRGDNATAVKLFNEAMLLAPKDLVIREGLARAQLDSSMFVEAEENLGEILVDPNYKERRDLRFLRAKCLVQLDRNMEARDTLVTLTTDSQGANDVDTWIELGNLSLLMNDEPRARRSAARVIALAPDKPDGYMIRGVANRRAGNLDSAAKDFQKAIELGAGAESHVMLGVVREAQNRHADARQSYQNALAQDPARDDARKLLAAIIDE